MKRLRRVAGLWLSLNLVSSLLLAGGIRSDGIIESTSGGIKYPNGTVQTTAFGTNTVGSSQVINGSLTSSDVNSGQIQLRVFQFCPVGSSIGLIASNGTVLCESDDIEGWERVSFDFACANNNICSVFISCSSGKRVLGGGLQLPFVTLGTASTITMNFSRPRDDVSWEIAATNLSGISITYRVWAVCAPAFN